MYGVLMNDLRFVWDESKSLVNRRKHGVSFDDAQTVFLDENAIRYYDPDHSHDEDRFIMLGLSFKLRVLVVCHCYRQDATVIAWADRCVAAATRCVRLLSENNHSIPQRVATWYLK